MKEIYQEWTNSYGEKQVYFSNDFALAELLNNEVVFLGTAFLGGDTQINVVINNLFEFGSVHIEPIKFQEIKTVYEYWKKDPRFGPAIFVIEKNKMRPYRGTFDRIKRDEFWDIETICQEFKK